MPVLGCGIYSRGGTTSKKYWTATACKIGFG